MRATDANSFGVVAIGRNEGGRLKRCLRSAMASESALTIYVDSASSDGSAAWASRNGIEVVELDMRQPFTAARARNAGFARLREMAPELRYAQFLDGDCELVRDWPRQAVAVLQNHRDVCAAFGRRREREPNKSVYNRLCDLEWDVPVGEARAFGGDVMIRTDALRSVGGYRDDLIAGEEPELAIRLRSKGWRISRLDAEMTIHDAATTRLGQWWRRHVRSGYAFAEGSHLHGAQPERHWVSEANRAVAWGIALPIACFTASVLAFPWGLATWLIYPLQMFRLLMRPGRPPADRALLAVFHVLVRFPEAQGWVQFQLARRLKRPAPIIEYK
jgi:GT2 family glycosyltransferase